MVLNLRTIDRDFIFDLRAQGGRRITIRGGAGWGRALSLGLLLCAWRGSPVLLGASGLVPWVWFLRLPLFGGLSLPFILGICEETVW